jgi:hypothetical protein
MADSVGKTESSETCKIETETKMETEMKVEIEMVHYLNVQSLNCNGIFI